MTKIPVNWHVFCFNAKIAEHESRSILMVQADKYSILVADDNKGCRDDLESILGEGGYHTILADCGARALEIYFSQKIHLSILDINLPDIPGFEVVRRIKSEKQQAPFIFLSAGHSKELQIQALNIGAETVIVKPLDREILIVTVNHILEKLFEGGRRHFPCA